MYIKINNDGSQRFPYTIQDLRQENSNTSFPAVLSNQMLAEFGVYPVSENDQPAADRFSYAVKRSLPELVNGEWVVPWDVVAKSAEELTEQDAKKANDIRVGRNSKLSACDWTQITDAPLTTEQKAAWSTYRQALRDITEQTNFPWVIEWPTQPE